MVVHVVRPRVGDRLPQGIDGVLHDEVGSILADLPVDDLRIEAHRGDVERVAMPEPRRVSFHQTDGSVQCVGHVHHVHERTGLDGAAERLAPSRGVEDVDGIVRRATARRRHVRDQPREAHATRVDAEAGVIVVAEQLARHLRHAIHGVWPADGILRRHVFRRTVAKGSDRAGGEDGAAPFTGHFEHVHQAVDSDVPRQAVLAFGHGRE